MMALGSPPMAFMLLHPALENVQVMRLDVITASTAALHPALPRKRKRIPEKYLPLLY